ncbi:ribosome maturation factor RimP [Kordiimonas sediminis]|uniref:Ribosome maturation factor RimP n=1 Tax=Kordiimonas sediminis TaxID=1735581 RepID=A0A919E5Z6_9PROT|nr:ribosome maturation factor RimP [Kordiimonas sediminis]GHF16319.1 ribosome maturation factor RimP [Kordiimonas sediminis]
MSDADYGVAGLIEPTVESLGFELIRVTYGGGRKPTLQIMAERPDGTMSVDDCARLSREVSALLDVEDPLPGEYLLEVSSPGIDRPLTRRKDFERWLGFDAKVEMKTQIADRRRFRGILKSLEGNDLTLALEDGDVILPFDDVQKAKLLLTDELMQAVENKRSESE